MYMFPLFINTFKFGFQGFWKKVFSIERNGKRGRRRTKRNLRRRKKREKRKRKVLLLKMKFG